MKNGTPKSMTGFGRGAARGSGVAVEVEIKSVNHRFLDLNLKLPRAYADFESEIRERVSRKLERGRVEIQLQRSATADAASEIFFNEPLFRSLLATYKKALGSEQAANDSHRSAVLHILGRREVLETREAVAAKRAELKQVLKALDAALSRLVQMRSIEGKKLVADIDSRLKRLTALRSDLEKSSRSAPKTIRDRLTGRLRSLGGEFEIDPARLAAEAAILADRADYTEEIIRLESHLKQFAVTLRSSSSGRKLDFLLQEIGRELNTVASKAQDAEVQSRVIDGKAEVEKIKEQVQNLE